MQALPAGRFTWNCIILFDKPTGSVSLIRHRCGQQLTVTRHERSLALNAAGEKDSAEMGELNFVSLSFLPGPSSTHMSSPDLASLPQRNIAVASTSVAARCAKRRKTTGEYSIPQQRDRALCASLCEDPGPDLNTSRTTTRGGGASFELYSGTSTSQRILLDTSGQNSMSSSTDLGPEHEWIPKMPFIQAPIGQTTEIALQKLRKEPNTPVIFTPDNPSAMEVFSPPPFSSCNNATGLRSTTLNSHGRDSSKFTESSHRLSRDNGIPKVTLTAAIRPSIVAPPSLRISDGSHEASIIEEGPVPRTPAGFNTAANSDISSATSLGNMSSGQLHHAGGDSYVPSAAQPSSSDKLIPKELKARKAANSDGGPRKASRRGGSGSKKVKDKPKLITPLEYAQRLQSCLDSCVKPKTNYLKGKCIFYVGGDMIYASTTTRGRMEYVSHFHFHFHFSVPRMSEIFTLHV